MKQTLESRIGYHFRDGRLLETALTHSSYANERHAADIVSYERLEFLGDSVLGLTTAEYLYAHRPALPEGRMTRLRAELVCESSLHKTALSLGLGEFMRLGRGEELTGGRERASILADMRADGRARARVHPGRHGGGDHRRDLSRRRHG